MSKKLKKKLLCLCLLFTLTLQCVPCNVKADESTDYNNYSISVQVDNQNTDDYSDYTYVDEYVAFTNHAFNGSVSASNFGDNDRFAISIDGTDMSSYIDNQVSSHKYSIPKDVIQGLYSKGEQHIIKYSVYSGDTEVVSKSFSLLVKNPYVKVERNDNVNTSFSIGEKGDTIYYVWKNLSFHYYDWDSPIDGQYIDRDDIKYANCEIINDVSTPDAFELVEDDGLGDYQFDFKCIYANSVGKGKLRIHYGLPSLYDNFYDENGGYVDTDLVSSDETVYADISSSLTDKDNVVSGSEFSLSADIKSYPSMNDADEFEREIKSSSWTVPDGLKDKISITPDKNDAKKCTVALSKDIKEDSYEITYEAVYVASDGTDRSVSDTFSFAVIKDKIEISCSVPDYMNVGDTYTIKPELYKHDSNGKTLLKYDYALVQSYSPYAIAVNDNKDGSYMLSDLYRSDVDSGRSYTISVKLKYNGAWIKQSYSIREPEKELKLLCYRNDYDGRNDMTLCLDTSGFEMKYDEIKLYYENNDNDKVAIDNKNYSVKNGNNAIYYTIQSTYLKTLFEASESDGIYIYAVAVKDGNDIGETYVRLRDTSYQTAKVTFGLRDSINADIDYSISSLVNAGYESKNCTWKVDSVKSSDENVISITNNAGSWKYRGNSAGKATVSIDYSIYYKDSVIKDTYSQEIEVNKYTLKATRTDSDQYVYSGDTYYWQLQTFNNENGDSSGEMTNVSYEWSVKNARNMSVNCNISDNELEVTPYIGDLQALSSCQLVITAEDEYYNTLATTTIDLQFKTTTYYDAFLDGMTISGDKKSITGVPKLMYYSNRFPNGTDMSDDYSFRISNSDDENVSVVKNTDGSYTFTQNDEAFDTVVLEWYNVDTDLTIANCYIEFGGSSQDSIPTEPTEVDKKMGLAILNSDSMDMNFYFVSNGDRIRFLKYSFDDGTVKYVPVSGPYWDDDDDYVQNATICITSGQLTSNIKIELLNDNYEIINTFSQSAESYIKSLLSSDDEKYAKYKPLLKSMLNFGTASQLYFGYNTNALANRSLSDSDKVVKKVPDKIISKYHAIKKIRTPGITYCGSSLIVNDEIIVRHYFMLDTDRDISNYDFSIDGSRVKPVEKNGMYYVESASDTSSFFSGNEVKVDNGHTESYFKYSPLNYISKVYSTGSADSKLTSFLDAMYWFRYEKVQLNK